MDNITFLYLNLLIPIRLVMNNDIDELMKNINTGLYCIAVALINNVIFSAINMDVIIKTAPPRFLI